MKLCGRSIFGLPEFTGKIQAIALARDNNDQFCVNDVDILLSLIREKQTSCNLTADK